MKKKIQIIALVAVLVLAVPARSQAYMSWPDFINAIEGWLLRNISDYIEKVLKKALRDEAIEQVQKSVNKAIGKNSGEKGGSFIKSWGDVLKTGPEDAAKTYMNDVFFAQTGGMGSSDFSGGAGGDYASNMVKMAKKLTTEGEKVKMDIQEYVSDPSNLFGEGNWKGFMAMTANPANNPFGYAIMAQNAKVEMEDSAKEIMKTVATSNQGYLPLMKDGKVATPGSILKDIQSYGQQMSYQALANTDNWIEIVSSMVTKVTTSSINQGL